MIRLGRPAVVAAILAVVLAPAVSLAQEAGANGSDPASTSDPGATHLFFGPTARSLPGGTMYLGVYEFLLPFVQVGVTDRFSIGAGTPLLFPMDQRERPFWVTPKLQVLNSDRTQAAVGVLHTANLDGDGGGLAYGVATHGNAERSFTIGAGMAYARHGGRAGVVMVGGETTVRRGMKLMTENYVGKGGYGMLSGGLRFFGERVSADVGLAIPIGVDNAMAFPIVNFAYVF
jgi:hypothetical protein